MCYDDGGNVRQIYRLVCEHLATRAVLSGCWRLRQLLGKMQKIKADRPVTTTCHYGKTYVLQLVKKKASLRSLWSRGYCCDHVFNGSGGLVERWSSNKVVLRTASSAVSLKMQHQKCCLQRKSITFCKKESALNHNFDWECKPRPFQVHVALYQVVLSIS